MDLDGAEVAYWLRACELWPWRHFLARSGGGGNFPISSLLIAPVAGFSVFFPSRTRKCRPPRR